MFNETSKKVDESWKERAQSETGKTPAAGESRPAEAGEQKSDVREYPPANFGDFTVSLGMQVMSAMGLMPGPSGKSEIDLPQAKYLIDTLSMLEGKTKNNLNDSEAKLIEQLLYDLRMRFVDLSNDNKSHSS